MDVEAGAAYRGAMTSMRVLVTGGAGFIGSLVADHLLKAGHEVTVVDDLSHGHRDSVSKDVRFVEANCGDADVIAKLGPLDACLHFAGLIEASTSMQRPEEYFDNNVGDSARLLRSLVEGGVERLVFSSSAAVYGDQGLRALSEDSPLNPSSAYGASKLVVEQMIGWLVRRGRLRAASLRYFNAAGAVSNHPERHSPETHLIPLAIDAALGRRPSLTLFGDDYPTADGTCVRDYVHVDDLARAHLMAMDALATSDELILNLGSGRGASNREVIESVSRVSGHPVPFEVGPRRAGDPAMSVADATLASHRLGWKTERSDLDTIVRDAWESRRP